MSAAGGAHALPLPAHAPSLFADLYADASNDATVGTGGTWAATMALSAINQANQANNAGTSNLQQLAITAGANTKPMGFTIFSDGVTIFYSAFTRMQNSLLVRDANTHNKKFAIDGDLLEDRGFIVETKDSVFNLPNSTLRSPTVANIIATLANDPAIVWLGPYIGDAADTTVLKVLKICPVPHSLGTIFLHYDRGLTWQEFFMNLYPVILTEGHETAYVPLIQIFQQAAVGDPSPIVNARLVAPPRNAHLCRIG